MVYSIDHHVCDQKLRTAQPRELADLKEYGAQHLLVRAISGIRAVRGIRAVCGIHEVSGIHAVSNSSSTSSDIRRRFTVVAWGVDEGCGGCGLRSFPAATGSCEFAPDLEGFRTDNVVLWIVENHQSKEATAAADVLGESLTHCCVVSRVLC